MSTSRSDQPALARPRAVGFAALLGRTDLSSLAIEIMEGARFAHLVVMAYRGSVARFLFAQCLSFGAPLLHNCTLACPAIRVWTSWRRHERRWAAPNRHDSGRNGVCVGPRASPRRPLGLRDVTLEFVVGLSPPFDPFAGRGLEGCWHLVRVSFSCLLSSRRGPVDFFLRNGERYGYVGPGRASAWRRRSSAAPVSGGGLPKKHNRRSSGSALPWTRARGQRGACTRVPSRSSELAPRQSRTAGLQVGAPDGRPTRS